MIVLTGTAAVVLFVLCAVIVGGEFIQKLGKLRRERGDRARAPGSSDGPGHPTRRDQS